MTLRASVNGSQLYKNLGDVDVSPFGAIPLEKTKILVGSYIGTMVPAFFVVTFTAATVLVYIAVCIVLRSPPGGAWELLQAHGRDNEDRILAGPPGDVVNIQEKGGNQEEI